MENQFVDILLERRLKSDILWASREWMSTSAYNLNQEYSPQKMKSLVLQSVRLNKILKKINNENQVPMKHLYDLVKNILNEIGYDRKEPVLRWLGFFVSKLLKRLLSAVYVNEGKFLKIRSQMGNNPLLFVPSHKSYCDFILMSYICFHYEVDIPRIAAGMDFKSMALMGNVLRDACAFFIRRSFAHDELYSAVFSQYVLSLVVYGSAAIEFFIEGTRSRTQKALMPKYGFLSMALKPFLIGLVPDITIVPVNLSYDRVLEEILFAYELLGIPKPKESTKAFLKALSILNENYGNIYVRFGDPISVKKYFGNKIDRSVHGFGSVEMQDITPNESKYITNLALSIVHRQIELTSLTCFNLIAAILNNYLSRQSEPPYLENLTSEVQWLFVILKTLAPKTFLALKSITQDTVLHHLNLHKSLVHLSSGKKVQLSWIHSKRVADSGVPKDQRLSNITMEFAIPILMLQYYVNPCANFLIGICFIALIVQTKKSLVTRDELLEEFKFLCSIFSFEFIFLCDFINEDFTQAFDQCRYFNVIDLIEENKVIQGSNNTLRSFCINFLNSYIPGYIIVIQIFLESVGVVFLEKEFLKACQQKLEFKLNNGFAIHPANFSLDLLANALQSFVSVKAVFKEKGKNGFEYVANHGELEKIYLKLNKFDFSCTYRETLCQHFAAFFYGTWIRLSEGIPYCWIECLSHKLRFFQEHLRKNDLMHKECIDIVSHLRKKYCFYIGQGIPDPWIDKSENPLPRSLSAENTKKYLCRLPHCKHLKKNFKKEFCIYCKKKYLFECPDDCNTDSNSGFHKNYCGKNAKATDCNKNCGCIKFLKSSVLKQKQSQGKSSKFSASSPSSSGLEAEGKDRNLKVSKPVQICEGTRTQKAYDSSTREKSAKERLFKYASCKKQSNVCFCPYVKSCYLRRVSRKNHAVKHFLEPTSSSKLIQAELQPLKISKTSQTENAESKTQIKCKCSSKCVRCSTYQYKSKKSSSPVAHSISCVCFPLDSSQNHAFICSCFFTNNFLHHNFNKSKNKAKKERIKIEQHKEKETEDEPNINPEFSQNSPKLNEKYNFGEQIRHKVKDNDFKRNKNISRASEYPKTFNHMKYLTDEKLKYYLQQEKIRSRVLNHPSSHLGSRLINLCRGDTPLYYLKPEKFELEKLGAHTKYKPRDFQSFIGRKINFQENHCNYNVKRFNCADQATMTKPLDNDFVAEDKFLTNKVESDEPRTYELHSSRVFSTKAMRKRRRLLRNRKKRKKLFSNGKVSFLEYQTLLNNLTVGLGLMNKQVQVKRTSSDFKLKRAPFSTLDTLSSSENTTFKFKNNTSNFEHITGGLGKKIDNKISSRNLKKLKGNETSEDTLKRRLRSELNIDGILEKISHNSKSSWSYSALKNIVNDLLMDKKYQEKK